MFPLSPTMWGAIGGILLVGCLIFALKIESGRLDTSKAETAAVQARFDAFVAQVKAQGEAQAQKAAAQDLVNQQLKGKADDEHAATKRELANLYSSYRRLHDTAGNANPGISAVPSAPIVASGPARTCYRTIDLAAAMGSLESEITRILEQGDGAIMDLNSAKKWARELRQ